MEKKKLPEELELHIRRTGSNYGYKGTGMCTVCSFRTERPSGDGYNCSYYGASCKSVSRNCLGSK